MNRLSRYILSILFLALLCQSAPAKVVKPFDRAPVIYVAASNTPAAQQAMCRPDFICDGSGGVDDATVVLAAINKLRQDTTSSVQLLGSNAAINYNTEGGTVYLLSGEYFFDSTLTITGPHHLELCGNHGTIVTGTMTDQSSVIRIEGSEYTQGLNRPHIHGFVIKGNYTNDATRSGTNLDIYDCQFTQVHDLHSLQAGGTGISYGQSPGTTKGSQNHQIANVQIVQANGTGLYTGDVHDFVASNVCVEECGQSATLGGNGWTAVNTVNCNLFGGNWEDQANGDMLNWSGVQNCTVVGADIESHVNITGAKNDSNVRIAADIRGDLTITGEAAGSGPNVNVRGTANAVVIGATGNIVKTAHVIGGRQNSLAIVATLGQIVNPQCVGDLDFNGTDLSIAGGRCTLGTVDCEKGTVSGMSRLIVDSTTDVTIAGTDPHFSIGGNSMLLVQGNASLNTTTQHAVFTIDAFARFSSGGIEIDGGGNTFARCNIFGHSRSTNYDITGCGIVNIGGTHTGSGTIDMVNCDTHGRISGLFHNSFTITADATSAFSGIIDGCGGTCTINTSAATGTWTAGANASTVTVTP